MDFELNEEQRLLRDTTREVLSRAYDTEKRNRVVAEEPGWSADVWKQLAEVGLLGLSFAEDDGGMDAGPVEIMAVMTEIGRRLAPEPVLDAVLIPGGLISDVGSTEQRQRVLPGVAEGSTLLAFAHNESGSRWPNIEVAVSASEDGGAWTLSGVKNPVPYGAGADVLVVSATLPAGGVGLFLVDGSAEGLTRTAYRTHDGRRGAQVALDNVAA
ncbi:MAG: acyl-CoA dehydrogenase family protein, partial [Rhodococcus sp. (in: high G+C Gram-positive bacteria)]